MSDAAAHRGQIILDAMGNLLQKRGFPNWCDEGQVERLPAPHVGYEVLIPTAGALWPIGMCARAAFDEYAEFGSTWLGTSVWEPVDSRRPLLGTGLMQESAKTWWTVDWMQQNQEPGLIIARLCWHDDAQRLADRLDVFVSAMEADSAGERPASFLRNHIDALHETAKRQRMDLAHLAS